MTQEHELSREVAEFRSSIHRRNKREAVAAGLAGLVLGLPALSGKGIETLTASVLIGAGLSVAAVSLIWGSTRRLASGQPTREAYRAELHRQARLLRWVPAWYLGPIAGALIFAAAVRPRPAVGIAFVVGLSIAIGLRNRRAAVELEQRAESLITAA